MTYATPRQTTRRLVLEAQSKTGSVQELASLLGVNESLVYNWRSENGDRKPGADSLLRILIITGRAFAGDLLEDVEPLKKWLTEQGRE